MIDHRLEAAVRAEVDSALGEQRPADAVLQFALGAVEADPPSLAVVVDAARLIGGPHGQIELSEILPADGGDLVAGTVAEAVGVEGGQRLDPATEPGALARRGSGHIVDHPAGGTDALDGIGAEDDLDPVDEKGIDGEAVTAVIPQRGRLRHPVDEEQRRAAAQGFAETGQLLPRRREGRDQGRHRLDRRCTQRRLLLDRGPVDQLDGRGQGRARQGGAGGGDDDVIKRRNLRCRLGQGGAGSGGTQGQGAGRAGETSEHRGVTIGR